MARSYIKDFPIIWPTSKAVPINRRLPIYILCVHISWKINFSGSTWQKKWKKSQPPTRLKRTFYYPTCATRFNSFPPTQRVLNPKSCTVWREKIGEKGRNTRKFSGWWRSCPRADRVYGRRLHLATSRTIEAPPPEVRIRGFRYALGRAKASSAFPVTFSFRLVNCRAKIRPSLLARNWNFVGIATGKPPNSTTTIFLSRIYRPSLLILFSPLSKYYSSSWFSYISKNLLYNNVALIIIHWVLDSAGKGTTHNIFKMVCSTLRRVHEWCCKLFASLARF